MTGVRVLLGSKSLEKAPSVIEVFGRTKQVAKLYVTLYVILH